MGHKLNTVASAAAGLLFTMTPAHAADATKDATATTCMATIGERHEVVVGPKAPIILQKLAASSLPKEGETKNPRAGRCDQVEDFTRLPVEHQQLVKDLYDKWRQDFSQLPEDNIVLAMSGVIKILARLPAVDEYLNDITTANAKYKDQPMELAKALKDIPHIPVIGGYLYGIAKNLGLKTEELPKLFPQLQAMCKKSDQLAATAQITAKLVVDMEKVAADARKQAVLSGQYLAAMQAADRR